METREIDLRLQRYTAAEHRIGANLQELEQHSVYQLLTTDVLTGATAEALASLEAADPSLWELFTLLSSALDKARRLRGSGTRIGTGDRLELATMLNDAWVLIDREDVPLGERGLTGESVREERMSIDALIDRMAGLYEPVRDVVTHTETVLRGLLPRLNSAEATVTRLRQEALTLGVDTLDVDRIDETIARIRDLSLTDPLSIPANAREGFDDAIRSIAARIAAARSSHDGLAADIAAASELLDACRDLIGQANQNRSESLAKIAQPVGLRHPPSIDAVDGDRGLAASLEPIVASTQSWRAVRRELDGWSVTATRLRDQLTRVAQANSHPLEKRDELRRATQRISGQDGCNRLQRGPRSARHKRRSTQRTIHFPDRSRSSRTARDRVRQSIGHIMTTCTEAGCGGNILADGYCDTCGIAPKAAAPPSPAGSPVGPSAVAAASAGSRGQVNLALVGNVCATGCGGTVLSDGYCNTCGLAATASAPSSSSAGLVGAPPSAVTIAAPSAPQLSSKVSTAVASSEARRTAATRRSSSESIGLGVGLVTVEPTPEGDPSQALMSAAKIQAVIDEVPEEERFCRNCDNPVGRGRDGQPGRGQGFCGTCRTPFDFLSNAPALKNGDLVGNQYEILGPMAHGGMGWIYLGKDKAVSDRWVVLKGLLNEDDADAIASAVAERQFLAQIEHGNIVNIYNFVTWGGAGYIVMEFVGGASLNSKLKTLRKATGDIRARMPLTAAISYMIGVLPALGYLHDQGLVYNDLKPANIMATANDVKLIDVGGVMRRDDDDAAIFGTQGFQAPEVARAGPSVPSDLYTVGRTLAVLALPFSFHQGEYLHNIPPATEQPILAQYESFHRFLLKSTAPHPDDRFQTAEEMRAQLVGVLREIVATTTGTPRPTPSTLFSGDQLTKLLVDDNRAADDPDWRSLPRPRVNAADTAASFLLGLPNDDPQQAHTQLAQAVADKQVPWTHETAFVSAMTSVDANRDPAPVLKSLASVDPWDWRIRWVEGLQAIVQNRPDQAAEKFSQVWTQVPGEIAPKLAVALTAEMAGEFARAASLYESIMATDPTYVTAAFGLARCRSASKDRLGAVAAYQSVPASSAGYFDARIAAARAYVEPIDGADPSKNDVVAAVRVLEDVQLDTIERAEITVQILDQALVGLSSGSIGRDESVKLFDEPMTDEGVRRKLERTYRELGRLATDRDERIRLIDKANAVRAKSIV